MPNLSQAFQAVVEALTEAGVPFAVCGGLAMAVHARPRATIDIDLLAPPEAMPRLVSAVAPLGFVRRERGPTSLAGGQVVLHRLTRIDPGDPEVLSLDVLEARPGPTAAAWDSRLRAEWAGRPVDVVSRQGLIALKRLRGSPQDRADLAALGDEP